MTAQVIVLGSYVQDQTWYVERFPRVGETLRAQGFQSGPGGKGFNQAVACARQGAATAFIGAIGDDALGRLAQSIASDEKLLCRWQTTADQPTASAGITVDAQGANQIVISLGANEHLAVDFVQSQRDLFVNARVLLLQMENNLAPLAAALALGRKHGLLRIWNPAPVHPQLELALLREADVVTPNETEFAQLLERSGRSGVDAARLADLADHELHALARELAVSTLVITLGARGCFVSHGADRRGDAAAYYRVAAETLQAIDTTGAGDAFNGNLAAALAQQPACAFVTAVRYANRAAALSTEQRGAAPAMPRHASVIARFGER